MSQLVITLVSFINLTKIILWGRSPRTNVAHNMSISQLFFYIFKYVEDIFLKKVNKVLKQISNYYARNLEKTMVVLKSFLQ